jgi:glycosyltransferase involved in cell wall biosynthesis
VITPVLNGRKYLEGCIESVLRQTYPRIDHVFVDGGSTDGTLDVLAKYSSKYSGRVRFITGKDKSPEDAWNKGICAADGQILGWLGADDVYYSDAVEAVVEFFRMTPTAAFVFGGCHIVNQDDQIVTRMGHKDFDLDEALNDSCVVPTPSAFFTREVVQKVGLLDTSFTPSDFDYWIRVAKSFPLYRIEKVLSRFRAHPGSIGCSKGIAVRYARVTYETSRRHGGRAFSLRFLRCLIFRALFPVSDFCRPVLGPIYPWVRRLTPWLW